MKKRIIGAAIGLAMMGSTGAGVAFADQGGQPNDNSRNHLNKFRKVWVCDGGTLSVSFTAGPHWFSDFNPSDVNALKPDRSCKLILVEAGALPLQGP